MSNENKNNGRKPKARGQPGPAEPKCCRQLPVKAALRLDDSLSANECCSASHPWLIAGMPQGDCFVVVNCRGECWDGARWVSGWAQAVQFRRPDPAYELCEQAAREAEQLTGVAGVVCYIPPGTLPSAPLVPFPDLSQVDLRDLARKPEVC